MEKLKQFKLQTVTREILTATTSFCSVWNYSIAYHQVYSLEQHKRCKRIKNIKFPAKSLQYQKIIVLVISLTGQKMSKSLFF